MTTLVNGLEQRGKRYGLQTMREVGGMANAGIFERLDEITPTPTKGRGNERNTCCRSTTQPGAVQPGGDG
jgi:hypothetical protein